MLRHSTMVLSLVTALVVLGCEKEDRPGARQKKGKETDMAVTIQWLGHASFKISGEGAVVYIDPWKLSESGKDATVVLVSHSHFDHHSPDDVAKVAGGQTKIIGPGDVVAAQGAGQVLEPGQSVEIGSVKVTGVASYNPDKQFHPKANKWLGFVVELGGVRVYYAGDTDVIGEMKTLGGIDVALLPVGGTYTMNAEEAVSAVDTIKPNKAIPYHWGDIVGKRSDADRFASGAKCEVVVLQPGQSVGGSAQEGEG
jgi:L-ascorbate metabolism protein UlaG (beta-lactamase superfamily)